MERERATKFIHELLDLLVKQKGSDLFITASFPPALKVDGKISPVSKTALSPQHTIELVRSVMNDKQAAEFVRTVLARMAKDPTTNFKRSADLVRSELFNLPTQYDHRG